MEYREYLEMGFDSIRQHKMRSLLTMLGVIFGVSAVIAMMSIAGGARKAALDQIKLLGTNNIRIQHLSLTEEQQQEAEYKGSAGLSLNDADMIRKVVPGVSAAAPLKMMDSQVYFADRETSGRIVGTSSNYDMITNFFPAEGRFISDLDVVDAKKICVLGGDVARELFKLTNPLGQQIRIEDTWYTVVGVMESKNIRLDKNAAIKVRNFNRDIYLPITTVFSRTLSSDLYEQVDEIAVQVNDQDLVVPASRIIDRLLLRNHNQVKDFEIVIPRELLEQAQKTQQIFNIVMGAIAAISLLVGGIGIMNIMLATVTERIKEIGIRRAIGASERDIMIQFLNETVFISVSGGIIGIILGALMAQVITLYAEWDTVISLTAVFWAFVISVGIGIVFGLYPAQKAARMDPIQALRTE
ncbi:MAG: ABC transporter permease [Calditrichia bacterium]|nr:ABC transporter permease [Calditrichota bacterium]MCB9068924.1 ABC transporter permease [Calditrichia bacterium]